MNREERIRLLNKIGKTMQERNGAQRIGPARAFLNILHGFPEYTTGKNKSGKSCSNAKYMDALLFTGWDVRSRMLDRVVERIFGRPPEPVYYPESIAGVKRGRPMSFDEADNGNANPFYLNGGGKYGLEYPKVFYDHKFKDKRHKISFEDNCTLSVIAFEARMRGYDVIAKPQDDCDIWDSIQVIEERKAICPYVGHNWTAAFRTDDNKIPRPIATTETINVKTTIEWCKKEIKPNKRYIFRFNVNDIFGHVVMAMLQDEKLMMYCPQSNEKYIGDRACGTFLTENGISCKNKNLVGRPQLLECDSLRFDNRIIQEVLMKRP